LTNTTKVGGGVLSNVSKQANREDSCCNLIKNNKRLMIYFLLPDSILPSPLRPAPTALLKFDNTPPPTFVTLDTVAFPAFDALLADWLPAFVISVAVGQ
jgi:hypothetical protein